MQRYEFCLNISPAAYLDYYRGLVRSVMVTTRNGQTLQFPAALLQKFVTDAGINGHFVLLCDANNKCVELQRVNR
jgi:hypothetical protein